MKPSHAVILALALPVSLVAQQPSSTPPANPITTSFRGRIMALHRNLAQAFDSIPESKFSYKPTPAQLSIGYIAQHLASDNTFFCNLFGDMKAPVAAEDTTTADSLKAGWAKEKLVTKLKVSFTFCQSAFAQLDDAKAGRPGDHDVPRAVPERHALGPGAGPRARPGGSLQPAGELHAAERYAAANRAPAAEPVKLPLRDLAPPMRE